MGLYHVVEHTLASYHHSGRNCYGEGRLWDTAIRCSLRIALRRRKQQRNNWCGKRSDSGPISAYFASWISEIRKGIPQLWC